MFSKETVEEIEWSRVSQDGTKVTIANCSPPSPCRLVEDCISSCPEYLTRLKADGLSIILSSVTQADRGLEFQCKIDSKIMIKGPEVYIIEIKDISPGKGQCDSRQSSVGKQRATGTFTHSSERAKILKTFIKTYRRVTKFSDLGYTMSLVQRQIL